MNYFEYNGIRSSDMFVRISKKTIYRLILMYHQKTRDMFR